jgi:hypothetical protein
MSGFDLCYQLELQVILRSQIGIVSIVQAGHVDQVEYFHIELDSHDVIIAERSLSESFIDDGSRGMFHNAHEYRQTHGDAPPVPLRFCAPRLDQGYEVEVARAKIDQRAGLRTVAADHNGIRCFDYRRSMYCQKCAFCRSAAGHTQVSAIYTNLFLPLPHGADKVSIAALTTAVECGNEMP